MQKAKARLNSFSRIEYLDYAVSNRRETLHFNPDAGSASCVESGGSLAVQAVQLDEVITSSVSFIKMDLEGSEVAALEGAKRLIMEHHPKLAIAAYHCARDFWQIPELVLGYRRDYAVYLRHYTEGWSETIVYFIPKC